MMLDVFKTDAFHFTKLVAGINKIPYAPTKLGDMGLFEVEPINTLTIAIELQDNVLTLVPDAPRGAPGAPKNPEKRVIKDFRTVHLPQRVAVMADEVLNLRAFGTESEEETASRYLMRKAIIPRRDLDITHEWQRMGAIKGQVLDADGSRVLVNYFSEFGVSQQTKEIALSNASTKVLQEVTALLRMIEDKLGGLAMSGVHVLCSAEFFDAFVSHPAVVDSYAYQQSQFLRTDNRSGFSWGGVWWEEYRGVVGGKRFIAANKALAIPRGVPGLFKTYFSPGPFMDVVGTEGLPFYMRQKEMDYNTGVEYQITSSPLHMCTRPDAIVELTAT